MPRKIAGEKTRIDPKKVLESVKAAGPADVVVVSLDHKGHVSVFGSSGDQVSTWMLREAEKHMKKLRSAA